MVYCSQFSEIIIPTY